MNYDDYKKWFDERVESNEYICGGVPVIKGTRLTIVILGGIAQNEPGRSQLKRDYPFLTDQDLDCCINYLYFPIRVELPICNKCGK